jgi:hypothetical protein
MSNKFLPVNIWRNRQGVAETDVVITKFYCIYLSPGIKSVSELYGQRLCVCVCVCVCVYIYIYITYYSF